MSLEKSHHIRDQQEQDDDPMQVMADTISHNRSEIAAIRAELDKVKDELKLAESTIHGMEYGKYGRVHLTDQILQLTTALDTERAKSEALRGALELARHKFIKQHARTLDEIQSMPTPYDAALTPPTSEMGKEVGEK